MKLSYISFAACINLAVGAKLLFKRAETSDALASGFEVLKERAFADSPTKGYAPGSVTCPANRPAIRKADSLSPNETAWLEVRRKKTIAPMKDFLVRMNIPDFDAASYMAKVSENVTALPNIGIAVSGGGYRALMNGAGFLAASDIRTTNSTQAGHIGGLLQSTTFLASLSGGGWLVGSIYSNNFSPVTTLRDGSPGSDVWKFSRSILDGPETKGDSLLKTAHYFKDIFEEVQKKQKNGFETTITDYWGRALSYQLVNATDGGPAYTFSSIALDSNFVNGEVPFPILLANSRGPGQSNVTLNSTLYEFNPFEFGSWDPTTHAFAPTRYLGSNFSAGTLPDSEPCIAGFDQIGYVMGTSSSLFNILRLKSLPKGVPSFISKIVEKIEAKVGEKNDDIAIYRPNPFAGVNPETSDVANSKDLILVDGGEDHQNLPLNPLLQPLRGLDVIFAVDSTANSPYNWPNGSSLIATYERSLNASAQHGMTFPSIPDWNTFINLGLNTHPTFFGCNVSNFTSHSSSSNGTRSIPPLIVYLPNAPYIMFSNASTYDFHFTDTKRNAMIQNGYDIATMGNGTKDAEWGVCVACAVLSRSWTKTGTAVPAACDRCFDRYCWNGTLRSMAPPPYDPKIILSPLNIEDGGPKTKMLGPMGTAGAMVLGMVESVFGR